MNGGVDGYHSFLVMASKMLNWDFPGGPVVKTPHFQCKGCNLILDQGTKILHAAQCSQKNFLSWTKVSEGKALNSLVNLLHFV